MENITKNNIRLSAFVVGVVFVLVGILGIFNNPLLGLFTVGLTHDAVHLLSGAVLLYGAYTSVKMAKNAALGVGIVYALVTILGFVMIGSSGDTHLLGLIHINNNDNYLHLFLTIVLIAIGLMPEMSMKSSTPKA